ncbi:MAG: glycosyltransferase family 4 protein [Bacteroidaceae bacterium]|jgi:glycosyltransferase involved in cell wall biosynthesis|nr:glycosyltransferase family 4 protein [Bacteroidaceae bacterium]
MNPKKIKVAWICRFSNQRVRSHLPISRSWVDRVIQRVTNKSNTYHPADYDIWISNGIVEMESMEEIELHVISPCDYLSSSPIEFYESGIYYHFYVNEVYSLRNKFLRKLGWKEDYEYKTNRKYISDIVNSISPDIVHVIGADCIFYSLSTLDIPRTVPIIVQLQTLLNDPEFEKNYLIPHDIYMLRSKGELEVLKRANYIGTGVKYFYNIIHNSLVHDAVILNINLPLTEPVNEEESEKPFDFVYFAKDIEKSVDYAIEAFALAAKQKPGITLDIVGDYSPEYKEILDRRINDLGLTENVRFEGKLPTHDDVLKQIRLSRFAVLPMKIDLVTGTIREAMANGIPVVTTITPASPNLNVKRESVLLSKKGDFQAMADNMLRLLTDKDLAERIKENAMNTARERESNRQIISQWLIAYKVCIDNFRNGTPIPDDLLNK